MSGGKYTEKCLESHSPAFPVVGIGASAGGIEALKTFFTAMPSNSGMAFVVVQHLEPSHESRMAEILSKCTAMDVTQAEDGMRVQPNCIYTNAPGRYLAIHEGRLALSNLPEGKGLRLPIDFFLESLAEDLGPMAVCIILSGSSGADGPRGVRAVRGCDGICIAQDPVTAQFVAMPQGAIDTGLVDYTLPAEQMPSILEGYMRQLGPRWSGAGKMGAETATGEVEAVLRLLSRRADSDYHGYQKTTIARRIQRRMAIRQAGSMSDYMALLERDEKELQQLSKDMLIGVSSFFRDAEAFEELRQSVIIPLVERKDAGSPVRVWVPGCSTGEEAYSIAMLVAAALAQADKACPLQVFASDVDDKALDVGRKGLYPENIAERVPSELLSRFLNRQGEHYQVAKSLRDTVIFSRQNLLADPPFSKLDLVSCRNVLIYLELQAQRKVLSIFSFALNVGGHLFLGKSEGVAGMVDFFETVSKPKRIYRLTKENRSAPSAFPFYAGSRPNTRVRERERSTPLAAALVQANQDVLLRHFNAAIVLVDPQGRILHFYGETERYLGHPKGLASLNILDMTAGTLSLKMRHAMEKALQQDEGVEIARVALARAGMPLANVTVERLRSHGDAENLLAIIFEEAAGLHSPVVSGAVVTEDEPLIVQLEGEVKALQHELRVNAEEYDLANEELKTANEEVTSANEELQSANEELEASKEEMQSVNEELSTVNSQLGEKVNELTSTNNDLANLMSATEIATVFLDNQLRIKRFTPKATELLNLIPSDVGRPVSHIAQSFGDRQIAADAQTALRTLATIDKDVRTRDGRWYTMRTLPYRTLDDRIDGVVVTFSDVSRLKEAQDKLAYEKTYAETIVETVRDQLIVLDGELHVLSANASFYETFRVEPQDFVGRLVYDLGLGHGEIQGLKEHLEQIRGEKTSFQDFQIEQDFPGIGRRTYIFSARRIEPVVDVPSRILLALEDITDREKERKQLQDFSDELERRVTDRTALAEQRTVQLRTLAAELTKSEQRERERLAKVLHDNLQQLLAGARFRLSILEPRVQDETSRKTMTVLSGLLDQALETSRSLTGELSPTILFEAGLEAALPVLGRQMETNHGLVVHVETNTHVEQDEDGVPVLLYNAARELLFNVVKHAKVQSAEVRLSRVGGGMVQLVVSDEGVGFDPARLASVGTSGSGLGLFSLRERLEYMGGHIEIESAPGRGTRVTLLATVGQPRKTHGKPPDTGEGQQKS
jgi:two-component system, chemotaxis family, CheB/CheR fusion protein